jgi:sec-independent protein translocase protein TatC
MKSEITNQEEQLGKQMSFLEHLDEFRRRLVNSVIVVVIAFLLCFFVSDVIYDFLSVPIRRALSEANRREVPVEGLTGNEKVLSLNALTEGNTGRYVFDKATTLGVGVVSSGTSVSAKVERDATGKIGLFSDEPIFTNNAVIRKAFVCP